MKRETEEKIEREVKQIGLDIVIGLVILSLTIGFVAGIIVN